MAVYFFEALGAILKVLIKKCSLILWTEKNLMKNIKIVKPKNGFLFKSLTCLLR
jgi:hypothetical protein